MKKQLFLISTLIVTLSNAQSNDDLKRKFEKQNKENNEKFDSYIAKRYGLFKSPEVQKEIDDQRSNLAGFLPNGVPYFYEEADIRQVYNSNADALNTAGSISGLSNGYKGENIKFTLFDGGRIYAQHPAFDNTAARISNKEAASQNYSSHSTGVAGFIGSKSLNASATAIGGATVTGNVQGIAMNSTIDSYRFAYTVLPGSTTGSTLFQKILIAQPNISNHSYGTNSGWKEVLLNGIHTWLWGGVFTSPGPSHDLQGTYYYEDQYYDEIVYTNPSYIIMKSAGNYFGNGPDSPGTSAYPKYYRDNSGNLVQFAPTDTLPPTNCAQGFDCIGSGSLAKNIIVVGATNVISSNNFRYSTASDVVHSDYSSAGPRDDGGIKPDIVASGTNVLYPSTENDTGGGVKYEYGSGTSFSAPIVSGIIGLWTQIHKDLFSNQLLNAASAKTLMVHSASEAGNIGPDPWFGWGYINAKKGAELLVGKANNTVIFNNETLNNGVANTKIIKASGTEPLKVTISWIDPAYSYNIVPPGDPGPYNNRNSRLVNDLDLRIIDTTTNTIYTPWKLNANNPMAPATKGDNTVDNVEQVIVDAPVAGRNYRVEITNKGNLENNGGGPSPQNYSIIVTGYNQEVLATNENVTKKESNIIIAPTITKDIVKVLKAPKNSSFSIYDLSGKKIQSGTINTEELNVDLSSVTNGIYIIEVKSDKEIISKKIIKQ